MSPLLTLMTPMMTAMTKQMKNKTSFGCTADNTSQLTMMMDLPRIKIRKTNHSARQVGMAKVQTFPSKKMLLFQVPTSETLVFLLEIRVPTNANKS
jgi:hypothetical protein